MKKLTQPTQDLVKFDVDDTTILGIDASLQETGWAVYSYKRNQIWCGSIPITPKIKKEEQLVTFNDAIDYITERLDLIILNSQPVLCVIEDTFSNPRNISSSKKLIALGAIIRYGLHNANINYQDIAPCTLKLQITGNGHAKKEEMIEAINKITGLVTNNNNLADACGLCLIGAKEMFGSPINLSRASRMD